MIFRRQILPALLISQLILGQVAYTRSAQAQVTPQGEFSAEQKDLNRLSAQLENAGENDLPKSSKDAFLLTGQKLKTFKKGEATYDLSALDLNLPELTVTDLEKEVSVELDAEGSVVFSLTQGNQVVAQHTLSNAKPVAMARDKELFIFLDQSGTYRAIDMGYAKNALFRSPLPVVNLFTSKVDFSKVDAKIKLQFLKRDQAPYALNTKAADGVFPLDQSPSNVMHAGDLVVTAESADGSAATLVEELARSVIRTQVYTAETVLSFLAMRLNPEQFEVEIQKLAQIPDAANVVAQATESVDPFVKAAIQALPADAVAALKSRAASNLSRTHERVDAFTYQEWQNHYETLLQKIQAEEAAKTPAQKLSFIQKMKSVSPKELIYRTMTPKAMKVMAGLTLGGAATIGISQALGGNGPAWAVHLANEAYTSYIPAVLKDAAYRVTLLKSSLALSAFIPLVWGLGYFGNKKAGKNWKATKMLASMGMKVYAAIQLPFYHRLANLSKQQSFLKAMRLGLNPLKKIKAESAIGKKLGLKQDIFPGVNNPAWKAENGNQSALKAAATQALVQQKERSTTLSWMLASVVVSEEANVDPATLAVLSDKAQAGGVAMTEEAVAQYLESPEFRKKWEQVAVELQRELNRMKDPALLTQIEKLSPDELGRLYGIAKQTQEKIKSRGKVGKTLAALKTRWQHASNSVAQGFANFGIAEYEFLKNAEPSDYVVNQFWKQFLIDYSLAVVQMGLIGGRADLADPQALAANEHGPLWTNSGHFADMFGQVRVYGISVPASMVLVYQKAADITEEAYAPVEDTALAGVEKTEGFGKSLLEWAKGTTNLVKADYGSKFVNRLVKNIKTIQAGYLMSVVERVAFGGQHLTDASLAFVYMTVWATWQFGWMWEPINRGNQMYGERIAANAKSLTEVKTALGSAIRLDDPAQMAAQTESLKALYENSTVNLPAQLGSSIDDMFTHLENLDLNEIQNLQVNLKQNGAQIDQLRQAIVEGNQAKMKIARDELMAAYQAAGAEAESMGLLMKLNAVSLLEFTMQNPPFAVKANAKLDWFTTMMGAVLTTYYATSLSVDTFRKDISWGEKIGEAALISAGLYATTYYAPRIWTKWVVPAIATVKEEMCNLVMTGKFRSNP